MIYLLHIDTSADTGMVGLAADGKPVAHRLNTDTRNQAANINIMIEEVLAEAGISMSQLNGVVVCAGPGSYTGLRIGMATAKALCYVTGIPLFLDNRLTLLANQAMKSAEKPYEVYMAALVAREKEYFVAVYDYRLAELIAPGHVGEHELQSFIKSYNNILLIGNIKQGELKVSSISDVHIFSANMLNFSTWAHYALSQYNCNGSVNLVMAEPFYLKQVYTHNTKKNS